MNRREKLRSKVVHSFRYNVCEKVIDELFYRSEYDFNIHPWLRDIYQINRSLRRAGESLR